MNLWLDWHTEPLEADLRRGRRRVDAHCHVFGPAAPFPYAPDRNYTPPDARREQRRAAPHSGLARRHRAGQRHGTDNRACSTPSPSGLPRHREVDGNVDAGTGRCTRSACAACDSTSCDTWAARRTWTCSTASSAGSRRWAGTWCCTWMPRTSWNTAALDRIRVPFVIDHMGRVKATGWTRRRSAGCSGCCESAGLGEGLRRRTRLLRRRAFTDAVPFAAALVDAAPDRVLWGTDCRIRTSPATCRTMGRSWT